MSRWVIVSLAILMTAAVVHALSGAVQAPQEKNSVQAPAAKDGSDPRDFGAAGDGIADDGPAIQQAVDAGRGRVVLSAGTYRVTHRGCSKRVSVAIN